MSPVLEARGVGRTLPGPPPVTIVTDASLAVGPGEFVAVTGPSGSGKSSLLYLLGLLDRPSTGTVLVDGRDTGALEAPALDRLRLERLGFVFQFHFLLPEFTALENVHIPIRRLGRLGGKAGEERARALLADLGLAEAAGKYPDQLSGGMRQRAAIARALANDPAILLADEPTGNLDADSSRAILDLFLSFHAVGVTVLLSTHDESALAQLGGRRLALKGGLLEPAAVPA